MCTQTVSLVAAVLEQRGIATAAIALLRDVAVTVRPPRALAVPFPHGSPLDRPHDPARQHRVLDALLDLLDSPGPAPVLRDFAA